MIPVAVAILLLGARRYWTLRRRLRRLVGPPAPDGLSAGDDGNCSELMGNGWKG
jgi:hypothetical protein